VLIALVVQLVSGSAGDAAAILAQREETQSGKTENLLLSPMVLVRGLCLTSEVRGFQIKK